MFRVLERLDPSNVWLAPWVRHQHRARYDWAAQFVAGKSVLDIACGTGYGSRRLAAAGATHVTGVDVSADAIRTAQSSNSAPQVVFELGDATALRYPDACFDVIVSFETIEHIERDDAFVVELGRVLKRGGLLLCSTPNRDVMNPATTIRDGSFNPHHVREYTAPELEAKLSLVFSSVAMFGQRPYTPRYQKTLAALASHAPIAGVRAHQLAKLLSAPLTPISKHQVQPLRPDVHPEILIALCRH